LVGNNVGGLVALPYLWSTWGVPRPPPPPPYRDDIVYGRPHTKCSSVSDAIM
jgi:hypothetical protein